MGSDAASTVRGDPVVVRFEARVDRALRAVAADAGVPVADVVRLMVWRAAAVQVADLDDGLDARGVPGPNLRAAAAAVVRDALAADFAGRSGHRPGVGPPRPGPAGGGRPRLRVIDGGRS